MPHKQLARFTPDRVTELKPHQVIVFGTNTEGRHGAGLAKECLKKWGAVYGQARGLQGQCYGIVTKDLAKGERSIPLEEIDRQIEEFLVFAAANPDKEFLFTKIGCGLGGYQVKEIAALFKGKQIPSNVILSKPFAVQGVIRSALEGDEE